MAMAGRLLSGITKSKPDSPEEIQRKAKEEAEKKAKKEKEEADKKAKKEAEDAEKKRAASSAGDTKTIGGSFKNLVPFGKSADKTPVSTTPKPPASIADAALKTTPAGMFRLHLHDDQSALFKFSGTTSLQEVWAAAQKRYPSNLTDQSAWEFRTMQDMPLSSKAWDVSLESLGSPTELRLLQKKPGSARGPSNSIGGGPTPTVTPTPASPTPAPYTPPTPAAVGSSTLGRTGGVPSAVAAALRGPASQPARASFTVPASSTVPPNSLRIYVPGEQNNMVVRIEAGQTLEHAYHKVAQKYPGSGLEDISKFEFRTLDLRVHVPMTTMMDKTPCNELAIGVKQLKIVLPAGIAATFDFHDGSNLAEIVDEFKKKYFQYAMGRFELVAADTDTTLRNYGVPLKFVNSREFLYRAVSNSDEPEEFVLNAEFDPKGVKPPPQNPTQRVWWLLGQLLTSMNKGVYLTPALYVPAAAWKSKPALPALVPKIQALDYTISQLAKLQSIYIGEIDQLMAAFDSFLATGDVVHAHLARELPFMKARGASQRGATASRAQPDPSAQATMASKTYDPTFIDIIYQQQLKKFFETCDFLSKYTAWFQEGGNSVGLELTAKLAQFIQETFLVFIMHDLRTFLHKYFRQGCEEL